MLTCITTRPINMIKSLVKRFQDQMLPPPGILDVDICRYMSLNRRQSFKSSPVYPTVLNDLLYECFIEPAGPIRSLYRPTAGWNLFHSLLYTSCCIGQKIINTADYLLVDNSLLWRRGGSHRHRIKWMNFDSLLRCSIRGRHVTLYV